MMKILWMFALCSVTGCAQYTAIDNSPQQIKGITVTPSNEWNKVPSAHSFGGAPTWTQDGVSLNTISFLSNIKDGEAIVRVTKNDEYPVFRADMLPTELVELIETTIVKVSQGRILSSGQLQPRTIDSNMGFEYTFEYVAQDDLPRKVYVVAVIKNEQMHAILYQAARLHYYDSGFDSVRRLISTASIE